MNLSPRSRPVPDEVLAEQVKARLGRFLSHPGSVAVAASRGTVTLTGAIFEHEADRVLKAVLTVPGVRHVTDRLEECGQQGSVPALQGGRPRKQRVDIVQEHWSPAKRVLVGAGGATLLACALVRRSPLAILFGMAGAAMLVRAGSNIAMGRLLGQRAPRIDYAKAIHIAAPVDDVFAFWQNLENFPKFMRNVRSVRNIAENKWHWEVAGPFGSTVQWDAQVTVCVTNELIGWTTMPGSQVEHAGLVYFQPDGAGTRIQVEMGYNPPGAAFGHMVASLLGADPLTEMDEDLRRLKTFFETNMSC